MILASMARRVQANPTSTDLDTARLCAALLEDWYAESGRTFPWRSWTDEYRVLVTEVLLQRTRAGVVETRLPAFFAKYPDWAALASAPLEELRRALAPLGLSHRRAASLSALARALSGPGELAEYETMPGVGQYIGRAARVAMQESREAMVDANFVRVLQRAFPGPWTPQSRIGRFLPGRHRDAEPPLKETER